MTPYVRMDRWYAKSKTIVDVDQNATLEVGDLVFLPDETDGRLPGIYRYDGTNYIFKFGITKSLLKEPKVTVSGITSIVSPEDGEVRQVTSVLPVIRHYVFNTSAINGLSADDGTVGKWNILSDTKVSDYTKIVFDSHYGKDTTFDLSTVSNITEPADLSNKIALNAGAKQSFKLNNIDVDITIISSTEFTLHNPVYTGATLELETI